MKTRLLFSVCVLGLLLAVTGCQCTSTLTLSKGTYQLTRKFPPNTWEALIQNPIVKTHEAVGAGLKDLGLIPITNRVDQVSGLVEATFADGVELEIVLLAVSPNLTRISIRCVIMGDRVRTETVFGAIEKHL